MPHRLNVAPAPPSESYLLRDDVERVSAGDRKDDAAVHVAFRFWMGCNISTCNLIIGAMGPLVFDLGLADSLILAIIASLTGCTVPAMVSSLGPLSGPRTMVISRFFMGWYPAKVIGILNILMLIGFAILDVIAGGNILAVLLPQTTVWSVAAIVFVAALAVTLATFGNKVLLAFEEWSWYPQIVVIIFLAGFICRYLGEAVQAAEVPSKTDTHCNRLAYFNLVLAAFICFSTIAADFFVYLPERTSTWRVVFGSAAGLWVSSTLLTSVGALLGVVTLTSPALLRAYGESPGALIAAALAPAGVWGKMCCAVLFLGNVGTAAAGMYSLGLTGKATVLFRGPRYLWTILCGTVVLVCAAAGRDSIVVSMQNFISIVGYWVISWLGIFATDYLVFRRGCYTWDHWDSKDDLPYGYAASAAFCLGFVAAILSMAQDSFVGPIAKLARPAGVEVQTLLSCFPKSANRTLAREFRGPARRRYNISHIALCGATFPFDGFGVRSTSTLNNEQDVIYPSSNDELC